LAKLKATQSIESMLSEYDKLREEKKRIDDRMKVLSSDIKDYAEKHGTKNDTGSYYSETEAFSFGKQAKKSVSFDEPKALSFLKNHSFTECIETKEVINEKAVENRVAKGDISYADLEDITVTKVTYAIDIKKKDELPEVQETSATLMAASSKPKNTLRRK
jgi:hypothetical protein